MRRDNHEEQSRYAATGFCTWVRQCTHPKLLPNHCKLFHRNFEAIPCRKITSSKFLENCIRPCIKSNRILIEIYGTYRMEWKQNTSITFAYIESLQKLLCTRKSKSIIHIFTTYYLIIKWTHHFKDKIIIKRIST